MMGLRIAFATGLMLVAPGCQGPGVAREEIPEDPIAFIFHPEDEARRRAEVFAKRATTAARSGPEIPTVVHLRITTSAFPSRPAAPSLAAGDRGTSRFSRMEIPYMHRFFDRAGSGGSLR